MGGGGGRGVCRQIAVEELLGEWGTSGFELPCLLLPRPILDLLLRGEWHCLVIRGSEIAALPETFRRNLPSMSETWWSSFGTDKGFDVGDHQQELTPALAKLLADHVRSNPGRAGGDSEDDHGYRLRLQRGILALDSWVRNADRAENERAREADALRHQGLHPFSPRLHHYPSIKIERLRGE